MQYYTEYKYDNIIINMKKKCDISAEFPRIGRFLRFYITKIDGNKMRRFLSGLLNEFVKKNWKL